MSTYGLAPLTVYTKVDQANFSFTSLLIRPQGAQGGSTDPEETKEFDFLGLRCDHEVLEQLFPKNLSKIGIFYEFRHFLGVFLVLVALKLHGRIWNLENRILWFLPDL